MTSLQNEASNVMLKNIFDFFSNDNEFRILRKADRLELASLENDVDILISKNYFSKIKRFFLMQGFQYRADSHLTNVYLYGTLPHIHFFNVEYRLHFDCVFSLMHRSLMRHQIGEIPVTYWIPLDKAIQEKTKSRYAEVETVYGTVKTLDHQTEILHIVCHVIYDKNGVWSDYYRRRLTNLMKVFPPEQLVDDFEKVFFRFSARLIVMLQAEMFDDIYNEYVKFKGY